MSGPGITTRRAFLESLGLALGVGVVAKAAVIRPGIERIPYRVFVEKGGIVPLNNAIAGHRITHIDYETRTVTLGPSFYARDPLRLATPHEVKQYGFRRGPLRDTRKNWP